MAGKRPAADPTILAGRVADAAYAVFLEKGFAGATTELIAARGRISKRSIYLCFAGKDALFAAVVLAKRHLILDPPPTEAGPAAILDRLAHVFRLHISEADSRERLALLDLVNREASLSPALMEYLYDNKIIRTREILIDWLRAEQAVGRIHFSDVRMTAALLMDVAFGALQPRRRNDRPISQKNRSAEILERLEIVLAGLDAVAPRKWRTEHDQSVAP